MEFDLEYNAERSHLIIPEYGRHIQKLVNHCIALEDVTERNKMAKAIVDVMGNLQPHLRDVPDFKHKLWDQLFIMADFKLDVDSPYEKLEKEVLQAKPEKLDYPRYASKYRYYGNNIQTMIDTALTWEEGDARDALYFTIANHMKKCYLNWNKDTVDDDVIFKHLIDLSNGNIDLTTKNETLSEAKDLMRKRKPTNKQHNKPSNKQRPKKK
ncbi:MAG: methionyl-tRNA formyltransferase [Lutibacter sp.]|nr:MAG: methionyl-tRNA formyltransferase [Lutibacter sp.]